MSHLNLSGGTDTATEGPSGSAAFKTPEQLVVNAEAYITDGGLIFGLSQRALANCSRRELFTLNCLEGEARRMVANVATVARTIGSLVAPDPDLDDLEDFERVDGFTQRKSLAALLEILADASDHAEQLLRVASDAHALRVLRDEVASQATALPVDPEVMKQRKRAGEEYGRTGVLPDWAPGQPGGTQ